MKEFSLSNLRVDLQSVLPTHSAPSERIEGALRIAFEAHKGQFREQRKAMSSRVPYITHPVGVAKLVASEWVEGELQDSFEDVISAALTHDVLEDSRIDFRELVSRTSARTAEIVLALTKPIVGPGFSNDQRNAALTEQIRASGSTARFIKICDSIHNLSRPDSMPISLLEKSIRKAQRDYLPLKRGQLFEARLGARLEQAIERAKAVLLSENGNKLDDQIYDLESVFQRFGSRARGKVLEEHDIIGLIGELPSVVRATIQPLESFVHDALPGTDLARNFERQREQLVERGDFHLQSVGEAANRADKVFLAPLAIDGVGNDQRFVLAWIVDGDRPHWLTPSSYRAAVALLTDRLRARKSRELFEYVEALSHFGLEVDAKTARDSNLSPLQMKTLKGLLEAASFVKGGLIAALETLAHSADQIGIDRIEQRVKTSGSILRKMRLRNLGNVTEIDDLIGVRVMFISARGRNQFAGLLHGQLLSEKSDVHRMIRVVDGSVRVEQAASDSGYTATHLYLQLEGPRDDARAIACEIQLRTIFEDAWARVSQSLAYKDDNRTAYHSRLLHSLARLRDQADVEIADITK